MDQRGRAGVWSSRGSPRHGMAGTGAGKAQAAAGSWGHHGLTSYCSNTPQLSVEAMQVGRRHRRALTSCKQTPPPCLGGTSITGTVGWPACDPPVSPQRDATSHRLMDTCTATAATSHTLLHFAPQLSPKGAGKGLANTGFLSL